MRYGCGVRLFHQFNNTQGNPFNNTQGNNPTRPDFTTPYCTTNDFLFIHCIIVTENDIYFHFRTELRA